MSRAAYMRDYRKQQRREREGFAEFTCTVKVDRLALALGEDGILKDWDDCDRAKIEEAFQKMVDAYVFHMIGDDA